MRTLLVALITFILMAVVFWALGGFISTVWNPMAWPGIGRLLLVVCCLGIGGPISIGTGCAYWEEVEVPRRKQS